MPLKNRTSLQTPSEALSKSSLTNRLLPSLTPLTKWHWLVAGTITCFSALLRFFRLGQPDSLVFDETYYVKDAYSLLMSGYERAWKKDADALFNQGDFSYLTDAPGFVVHPPVGKWLIALGMGVFGPDSSYGWRVTAALAGSLSVLLIVLIGIKLFASPLLGGLAGLYLAIDGHHLVQSRTGLLDIFLSFFIIGAFFFLLLDRENGRKQLVAKLSSARQDTSGRQPLEYGPVLWWRPWRFAAVVFLALALGTKWSALAVIAVFCIMAVLWDMNARRMAGIKKWFYSALTRDGLAAFCRMVPLMLLLYLGFWTGWFLSENSWGHNWAAENPDKKIPWLPDALASLWNYHQSAYNFHSGLNSAHPYASQAWQWLPMIKPTSYFYRKATPGERGCGTDSCSIAINNIANPLIWWTASLAVIIVALLWLLRYGMPAWLSRHHDWRAGAVLSGILGGYVPWLFFPERTTYFFYAVSFEPFMILALCYCFALLFERSPAMKTDPADTGPVFEGPPGNQKILRRRKNILLSIAAFTVCTLLVSAFFYPLWTAETVPYLYWKIHMWFPSWI